MTLKSRGWAYPDVGGLIDLCDKVQAATPQLDTVMRMLANAEGQNQEIRQEPAVLKDVIDLAQPSRYPPWIPHYTGSDIEYEHARKVWKMRNELMDESGARKGSKTGKPRLGRVSTYDEQKCAWERQRYTQRMVKAMPYVYMVVVGWQ